MSKTWVRKEKIADVGKCRYCKADMISTDSFVAFANHTKAHYKCMKEDDETPKQIKKFVFDW
tara:strand:- start:571 stop:756 length:186 start_codon:yes stop_codon:yes gene_type:complete